MRKTSWRVECARLHDRYAKVQNRMRGNNFSSSPPSSTRNVDGARPANMLRDLPGNKSQVDLRPLGVGVLEVGCTIMP